LQTIVLNAWCLIVAIIGTRLLDQFGRKTIALVSNAGMVVLLFVFGALTAGKSLSLSLSFSLYQSINQVQPFLVFVAG
jgi:hypothetical protein